VVVEAPRGLQEGSVAAPIVALATTARRSNARDNREPGRPLGVGALVEKGKRGLLEAQSDVGLGERKGLLVALF
jgi:hypothetical protein